MARRTAVPGRPRPPVRLRRRAHRSSRRSDDERGRGSAPRHPGSSPLDLTDPAAAQPDRPPGRPPARRRPTAGPARPAAAAATAAAPSPPRPRPTPAAHRFVGTVPGDPQRLPAGRPAAAAAAPEPRRTSSLDELTAASPAGAARRPPAAGAAAGGRAPAGPAAAVTVRRCGVRAARRRSVEVGRRAHRRGRALGRWRCAWSTAGGSWLLHRPRSVHLTGRRRLAPERRPASASRRPRGAHGRVTPAGDVGGRASDGSDQRRRRARRGSACTSCRSRTGRARCGTGRSAPADLARAPGGAAPAAARGRRGRPAGRAERRRGRRPAGSLRRWLRRPRAAPAPSMVGRASTAAARAGAGLAVDGGRGVLQALLLRRAAEALGPDLDRLRQRLHLRGLPAAASSTWTSRLNRKPTASSLMPSIIWANMSKPSRWYSTSGSRWAYARRPTPSWR